MPIPMSIHVHAAPDIALGSVTASLSVRTRRPIAAADMSETVARRTVVDLTLRERGGRFSLAALEFSIARALHGCGVPSK